MLWSRDLKRNRVVSGGENVSIKGSGFVIFLYFNILYKV